MLSLLFPYYFSMPRVSRFPSCPISQLFNLNNGLTAHPLHSFFIHSRASFVAARRRAANKKLKAATKQQSTETEEEMDEEDDFEEEEYEDEGATAGGPDTEYGSHTHFLDFLVIILANSRRD